MMLLETILSGLGGGVLRVVPEVIGYFNKKQDNEHERLMMDRQLELGKQQGELKLQEVGLQGDIDQMLASLQLHGEALKGQTQLTGMKIVDALNMLVRPIVTYWFLFLYSINKVAMIVIATEQKDAWKAIKESWTPDDVAIFFGILGFWFVSRVFDKRR